MRNFDKAVKAFNRGYSVNTEGEIIGIKGGVLSSRKQNSGYLLVHVCTPKRYAFLVHQLVWVYHKGYAPVQINHIDGDKGNNRISNLEDSTCANNIKHSYRLGLRIPNHGTKSGRTMLTDELVEEMRILYAGGMLIKDIASVYNVGRSTASYIVNHRTWRHIC